MSIKPSTSRVNQILWGSVKTLLILSAILNVADSDALAATQTKSGWHPKIGDTFQIQLTGALNTKVKANIYDVDLLDISQEQIAQLKGQGRKVVCYFSAGSSENWRPDFSKFRHSDIGLPLSGWQGENWLDVRSRNVRAIMSARIELAARKGCDGVDPDNVDGYSNATGFNLTSANQLDFNKFLSNQAHSHGLAIGLKNDVEQIESLSRWFDLAINEQCHVFKECTKYAPFTAAGKPVLNIEYEKRYADNLNGAFKALCSTSRSERIYTLVLSTSLDGSFRKNCSR